jgi:hypothetical protein
MVTETEQNISKYLARNGILNSCALLGKCRTKHFQVFGQKWHSEFITKHLLSHHKNHVGHEFKLQVTEVI